MATPILLPKQGNTVETCRLLAWRKKKGDRVKQGDIICEVETDKAAFDIDSPANGVLLDVFYNEGDDIPVLTNIAVVGNPGENYSEFLPQDRKVAGGEQTVQSSLEGKQAKEEIVAPITGIEPVSQATGISPRAAKLAEQSGLNIQKIPGTGPEGRVIERDVLGYAASSAGAGMNKGSGTIDRANTSDVRGPGKAPASFSADDEVQAVPLKGIRKLIADRMLGSLLNSAQLTLNSSASAANLLDIRKNFKSNARYHRFSSVTINDLVHLAVIQVLPQHPALNCLLQDETIFYFKSIHLGFAVDTPRGLMVPVIKHAQKLDLLDLSNEAKRLATNCVNGKILPDELSGGTFTVTNLGTFGVEAFTPVLNLPQAAILGVNAIAPRPVDNGKGVEFMPFISFSLTIDHRVIDGVVGAKFLQDLAKTIANISLAVVGATKE
jgi:pyruvate dehydrogenase E2 component (dihydrolipoamide acetyltransferase)